LQAPPEVTTLMFPECADIYKQRHVQAKGLAIARTIGYRLKPFIDRFGDRTLQGIRTADIEDFIADLKLPRVVNRQPNRTLSLASINRTIELLRHMMNWAGREYLERNIPARNGNADSETARRPTGAAGASQKRRKPNCSQSRRHSCDR